jgi:hypothetical protein
VVSVPPLSLSKTTRIWESADESLRGRRVGASGQQGPLEYWSSTATCAGCGASRDMLDGSPCFRSATSARRPVSLIFMRGRGSTYQWQQLHRDRLGRFLSLPCPSICGFMTHCLSADPLGQERTSGGRGSGGRTGQR